MSGFTLTNGATRGVGGFQIFEQCGGGVWCEYTGASVSNCIIDGNVAPLFGGGAYGGTLNNCLIMRNGATNSGGGVCSNILNNCTIARNASMYGAGGAAGAILRNCIIYFNSGLNSNYVSSFFTSCCTTPAPSGGSYITPDPSFVDLAAGNLRLQSNSPCINAGDNGWAPGGPDLDGNTRIYNGTVDIGAYEFQGTSSAVAPYIVLQPTNQTVTAGANATFSVTAGGSQPLNYQWRSNSVPLTAAINPSLVLTNVQLAQSGTLYSVTVSNVAGSVTSTNALLIVNPSSSNAAPHIALQPTNQTVTVGGNVNYDPDFGFQLQVFGQAAMITPCKPRPISGIGSPSCASTALIQIPLRLSGTLAA